MRSNDDSRVARTLPAAALEGGGPISSPSRIGLRNVITSADGLLVHSRCFSILSKHRFARFLPARKHVITNCSMAMSSMEKVFWICKNWAWFAGPPLKMPCCISLILPIRNIVEVPGKLVSWILRSFSNVSKSPSQVSGLFRSSRSRRTAVASAMPNRLHSSATPSSSTLSGLPSITGSGGYLLSPAQIFW